MLRFIVVSYFSLVLFATHVPEIIIKYPQNYTVVSSNELVINYDFYHNNVTTDATLCLYEHHTPPPFWKSGSISFPRSHLCYDMDNGISDRSISITGMSPGTFLFTVALFDKKALLDHEVALILAHDIVLIDVYQLSEDTNFSIAPNIRGHQSYRDKHRIIRVGIFLLDFSIHGCNIRLWNLQGCLSINSGMDIVYVSGNDNGLLLTIDDCSRDVIFAPTISNCDTGLDAELVQFLQEFDVILVPNSHGDKYTDCFIRHTVAAAKANSLFSPVLVLDLCNLPVFKTPYADLWTHAFSGYISPSHGVALRTKAINADKYVTVVNPPIGSAFNMLVEPSCTATCQLKLRCCECIASVDSRYRLWPREIQGGRFRIACVGRLSFERSPGLCIHVIKHLLVILEREKLVNSIDVMIIGSGPLLDMMIAMAKDLQLDAYISFIGTKSQEELFKVLSQVDLVLNTVLYETFGISNAEAQVAGTFVAAWDSHMSRESLNLHGSLLVNPNDEFNNSNMTHATGKEAVAYLLHRFAVRIRNFLLNWESVDRELVCHVSFERIRALNVNTHALRMSKMLWRHFTYAQLSTSEKRLFRESEEIARVADIARSFNFSLF